MNTVTDIKISELTLGQLVDFLDERYGKKARRKIEKLSGLAEYLGCSLPTAQRLKSSGKIDKAIIQSGRTIVFDADMIDRLLSVK